MHPTLAPHLHPMCGDEIRYLQECHAARPLAKFLGACNSAKAALDKCLADEYLVRRELNAEKSREEKGRLKKRLEEDNMT